MSGEAKANSVWSFATAGNIHFGRGCRGLLIEELQRRHLHRPLVVTDSLLAGLPLIGDLIQQVCKNCSATAVFDQGRPEPAIEVALQAIEMGRASAVDCVIGIGGGSNLDVAKIVATVLKHGGCPSDYFGFDRIPSAVLPVLAVPTTAGTGSEVSHSAVLTDVGQSLKVSTLSHWLRPTCAVVDPALTDSCPRKVTAESGIDALVHAIEAFTARSFGQMVDVDPQAKAYQGSYPLTQMMAAEAIRLVGRSLVTVCDQPNDQAARDDMALAATLAGMAFSNSGVGIVHALEYPIGTLTHCGHGEGNGLLLPHVMRYNLPVRAFQFAQIGQWLGDKEPPPSPEKAAERAIELVVALQQAIGIRTRLADLGMRRDAVPQVAEKAFAIRRLMDLNPQPPTLEDLQSILHAAF